VNVKNPFQVPRLEEIQTGKKFWGYLDTEALQMRYVLAAHFLRNVRHIVEVGGYRNNAITNFVTHSHDAITVFSLDAEFEAMERDTLNGAPCRVRHIQDYFQNHPPPAKPFGLVALGLEIHGDLAPFLGLVREAQAAVMEVPIDHRPSVDCLTAILTNVPCRVRCQVDLDFSSNEPLLRDELVATNMNVPFWKRRMYVLEAR